MLFVDRTHECCCRRENLVDKDEDSLLWCELDTLPDHVYELADGKVLHQDASE